MSLSQARFAQEKPIFGNNAYANYIRISSENLSGSFVYCRGGASPALAGWLAPALACL
jgi:hypothetical protein